MPQPDSCALDRGIPRRNFGLTKRHILASVLLGVSVAGLPRPAMAQPNGVSDSRDADTASGAAAVTKPETTPQQSPSVTLVEPEPELHAVRAVLTFETVFLLGWGYYLMTADFKQQFDIDYRWDVFRRKISGESFVFDTNHFGTNFIGHPLGGAGYYLSARSNGMGTLGSSAISVTGSLLWELFGEVREEISMNDMITTPMAGIAIGETTYQMARFFDRAEGNLLNRTLGLLLGPFTTLNDVLDGHAPERVRSGYPRDGWHQVMARAALSQVYEAGAADLHPEAELLANVRVESLPVPHEPQPLTTSWFDRGNITQLRVELAASSSGLSRVEVATNAVLGGIGYRASRGTHDAEFGYVGLGMGFHYTGRSYDRSTGGPLNRLSGVQPMSLSTGHHVRRGAFTLDGWLRAGPAFAGMDVLSPTAELESDPRLPPVTRLHGYYMGWGASSEAQVQMGFHDLRWGGGMSAEAYRSGRAPGELPVTRLLDSYRQTHGYFGYHFPGTSSELRAFWVWRDRAGTADRQHLHFNEHSLGLQLCAFGN